MFVFKPCILCALLLSTLLSADADAPGSSECVPQDIPNMVIDVTNAVAKGARFTDPVKAASAEECMSACCSRLNSVGDRTCNLAVYDTRKSNLVQNCYLFFCPKRESCPMSFTSGVLSYSFWTEKEKNPDSTEEHLLEIPKPKINGIVQNSSGRKSSPAVKASIPAEPAFGVEFSQLDTVKKSSLSDSKTGEVKHVTEEDEADTADHIASKLLNLANNIEKRLEKFEAISKEDKIDSESVVLSVSPTDEKPLVEPTSSRHKDLKKLSSDIKDTKSSIGIKKIPDILDVIFPTPELSTSAPFVSISHPTNHPTITIKPTVISSTPPSKESKGAKKAPSSDTKIAKVLSSHNSASYFSTAATVKNMRSGHLMITTQVPTKSAVYQTKSALPVTRHHPSQTLSLTAAKSTIKDANQYFTSKGVQETVRSGPELTSPEWREPFLPGDIKEAPRNLDTLDTIPGDKSGLVAALVFGVIFFVLIVGLVSHKVSEARRRQQYTKLDYLINGMYVDT